MNTGTVWQRHTRTCPRGADGKLVEHRCRGPWGYTVDAGRHPDGRRRQATKSGFTTRREAREALAEHASKLKFGLNQERRLTVSTYLDEWLEAKRNLRMTTRSNYHYHLEKYLKPGLGHIPLTDLRVEHIDAFYTSLLHSRGGSATAIIQTLHRTLRSALNTAARRRLIQWNPATLVELPTHHRKRSEVWDADQVAQFLEAARSERLYPVYYLLLFTGMRRGEVLGLHWRDVSLEERQLRVAWQLVDARGKHTLQPPKTASGARIVPIDASTADLLASVRDQQILERAAWGPSWEDTGLVMSDPDGKHLKPNRISKAFHRIADGAGLPRIRLHDLRHTHASLALSAGIDIKVVSDRLGHSTTSITRDLYTHVVPGLARQAADDIANLLLKPRQEGDC